MIKAENIESILSLYTKHGWNLRRVLLSDALRIRLNETLPELFGDAKIISSKLDAAWFSRVSKHGEAWELRNLGDPPFAFVEVLDENADETVLNEVLSATETRMLDKKTA